MRSILRDASNLAFSKSTEKRRLKWKHTHTEKMALVLIFQSKFRSHNKINSQRKITVRIPFSAGFACMHNKPFYHTTCNMGIYDKLKPRNSMKLFTCDFACACTFQPFAKWHEYSLFHIGIHWWLIHHSFTYFYVVTRFLLIFLYNIRTENMYVLIIFPPNHICMHDDKTIYHCRFIGLYDLNYNIMTAQIWS